MRLFGTLTSPYVRRVRIVAQELGLDPEWIDTTTPQGQAALRSVNPLWKVPTAQIDGHAVLDSEVISEHLMRHHGPGPLTPDDPDDGAARNVRTVIDGMLDSLINTLYLGRDGITAEQAPYLGKHHERAAAAMAWLEQRVVDEIWMTERRGFGLTEIALCTTVEWMRFRGSYPVERHPGLVRCADHHRERKSLVDTRPPT